MIYKPEDWTGTEEEFQNRIKEAAAQIRQMANSEINPIINELGVWLTKVILTEFRGEAVTETTAWDCSSYGTKTDEHFDMEVHETVGDFLDSEFTGRTRATYCPGSGFLAETYDNVCYEYVIDAYYGLIKSHFADLVSDEEGISDEVLDGLIMEGSCEMAFLEQFRKMPLAACFSRYENLAKKEIKRKEEESKLRELAKEKMLQEKRKLAAKLPEEISIFAGGRRFEKSNWGELIKFLGNLEQLHGKNKVSAALMFTHLNLSNSVRMEISKRWPAPTDCNI